METGAKTEMSVVGNWLLWAKSVEPMAERYIEDAGWGNDEGGAPGVVIIVKHKYYDKIMGQMPFLSKAYTYSQNTYPVYYRRGAAILSPSVGLSDPDPEPMFEGEFDFGFEVT